MEGTRLRALIADDQALMRWALSELASAEGFQVDTATTREETLGRLLGQSYALVVLTCDISGEDLSDLIDRVCEYQSGTEVIVLCAGHAAPAHHPSGHHSVVLDKPIDTAVIRSIARRVHGQREEVPL